jgi:hypothetical protein
LENAEYERCLFEHRELLPHPSYLIKRSYSILDCTLPPLSLAGRPLMMSHEFCMDELEKPEGTEHPRFDASSNANDIEQDDDELLAISDVVVELKNPPLRGLFSEELKVVAQSGNTVTIALSPTQNSLIGTLKLGSHLPQTRFFSPVAIFRAPCFVSKVSRLGNGPEQESYFVDITVESG